MPKKAIFLLFFYIFQFSNLQHSGAVCNGWRKSLCSCFDNFGLCLVTFIFPCVTFGQITHEAGTCSCIPGGISLFVPLWNIILMTNTRTAVRKKNNIAGDCMEDFLTIFCCNLCALVQMKQELDLGMGEGMSIERV